MKADDLVAADATEVTMDPDLLSAMQALGFRSATYSLFSHPTRKWVATIKGVFPDGTDRTWIGTGDTPDEAEAEVIDALSKWILNQPIPFTNAP